MVNFEEIKQRVLEMAAQGTASDLWETDYAIRCFLLDACDADWMEIAEDNRFFVKLLQPRVQCAPLEGRIKQYRDEMAASPLQAGVRALAYTGYEDFGHTWPEWDSILSLGIIGLRGRIAAYAGREGLSDRQQRFFACLLGVYDAALRFMARAAEFARQNGKEEMAQGLEHLLTNPPRNLYEAMQTSLVYYALQLNFDTAVPRTFGRLDALLYPFYEKEAPERADELVRDYLLALNSLRILANIPFALGGTDENGNSSANALSYHLLDWYGKLHTDNLKIHFLCARNTPDELVKSAFRAIRAGRNSIVFIGDEKVIESLKNLGAAPLDAARYHVVGCYECGAYDELTCSCNARVNLPKALEYALNRGKDPMTGEMIGLANGGQFASFEALFAECLRQVRHLSDCAMRVTNHYEKHYDTLNSSPILSGAYLSALEKGGDVYADHAARYNNSSLNAIGLATLVNSLAAIRKLVYEEHTFTLPQAMDILKTDWEGQEPLRLLIKNKYPKYGTGDEKTDALAREIVTALVDCVSGKPNEKGGVWRLGLFSIDWRWEFGKMTGASMDGRKRGAPLSQNTSADFGTDREGATAHLLSAASLDTAHTPNGAVVDLDLHISAVRGEAGLNALTATLRAYFALGGFAVHYNVLDTQTLKDAKAHPEKYPNLQVRLCGWNVLFSTLSEREKDEFIARSIRD